LERLLSLVKDGAVQVPPIQRFALSEAAEAHRISESRHLRGKLVFEVR
jgi:NADPH:quinone reductase-like Zn-dependent oxidoreductase